MLTRQIDRAVRLLHRDLPELFQDRAREDTLAQLSRTEAECRTSPGLAAQVERIARRAVQSTADQPPLADGIDPAQLDNVHVPSPPEGRHSENCENENCENEPPLPAAEATAGTHPNAPTPKLSSAPDYLLRCFLTGQRYRTDAPKNAKTNLNRSHWPFSTSEGGKVPDEGG